MELETETNESISEQDIDSILPPDVDEPEVAQPARPDPVWFAFMHNLQTITHEHAPDLMPIADCTPQPTLEDRVAGMPRDYFQGYRVMAETQEGWNIRIRPEHAMEGGFSSGDTDFINPQRIDRNHGEQLSSLYIRMGTMYSGVEYPNDDEADAQIVSRIGSRAAHLMIPTRRNRTIPIVVGETFVATLVRMGVRNSKHWALFYHGQPFSTRSNVEYEQDHVPVFYAALAQATALMRKLERNYSEINAVQYIAALPESIRARCGISTTFDVTTIRKQQVSRNLRNLERDMRNYQQQAISCAGQIPARRAEMNALNAADDSVFDMNTIQHPLIDSLYVDTSSPQRSILKVFTKDITCHPDDHNGECPDGINLGGYRIEINLIGDESYPVRFWAMRGTRHAYSSESQHPHVFDSGDPCFGSFGDAVAVALDNYDIGSLIDICIMFLQQANSEDSAGRYWPTWMIDDGDRWIYEDGECHEYHGEDE